MKCGTKKMAKGGKAIMTIKDTTMGNKMAGAARRTMAQEKTMPMKKGGAVRGMGAATKGAGKGPWA